jgi:NADPH:quinone reductase-like Zn-dependent oxidoreductase
VTDDTPQKAQLAWKQIVEILDRAGFRPVIDQCFPLESVADAFAKLNTEVFGKVVVEV